MFRAGMRGVQLRYAVFQITFLISVASLTSIGANNDTVYACVPDTFYNLTSSCRDVYYYLGQKDHLSCDDVCKVRGKNCTAVNHGFNDTSVLEIFASVLGHPCKKSYNAYKDNGPAYNQRTRRPYCTKWKNIPDVIDCGASPVSPGVMRLCPCIEGSPVCAAALGMEDGSIPDSNITASSVYSGQQSGAHRAANGRLHFEGGKDRTGAWSAAVNNLNQWLQVYFGSETVISGVATQGSMNMDQWVTSYSLSYSPDGMTFYGYHNNETFLANQDRNSVVTHTLPAPIVARYVRILPKTWEGHISMRVEFYGCKRDSDFGPISTISPASPSPTAAGNGTIEGTDHSSGNSVSLSKELQFIFYFVVFVCFQ